VFALIFFIEGGEAFDYGKNLEKCLGISVRNWGRFYWSFYLPHLSTSKEQKWNE